MARLPLAALAVLVLLCGGTGVLAMNATNATNATNQETQGPSTPAYPPRPVFETTPRKPFCSPLCSTETMLGDGTCDPVCMTASCHMDGGDCGGDLSYPLVANYHFMLLDTDADGVLTEYELITGVATSAVEMAPMVGKAVNASVLAAAFGKVMDKGAQGVTARQLQALAFSVVLPLFQGDRAKWTAIATYTINAVDTNWTGTTTCEEMNGARPDVAAACVEGMGQTFDVPLLAQRGINIDHQMGGEGRAWLGDEKGLRRALLLFSFITDVDGMPDSLSRFEAGGIFGINDAWFQSVDLDGDGALSVEEEMVMVTVLGQDACGGFQVVEDTAGEINKGIPITPGVCSWLISPNWFYKQATGGAQGAQTLSQEKATHLDQPSLRRQIPKESRAAAHASHARTAKLEQSLRTRQAARLRSREQVTTRGIDGVAAGAAFDFVAWISGLSEAGVSAHLCSGALIHATYVATTAECVLQVRGYLAEGKQALVHLGLSQGVAGSTVEEHQIVSQADLMVHSVYSSHASYDIGLIRLQTASSYSAVEVYDGGDLGVSDCDPINITMAGWGAWGPGAEALQVVDMSLVDRAAAAQAYLDADGHAVLGAEEFPAMTEHFPQGASPFACASDMGAPLVGIVVKTGKAVLLGLQNIGQSCHFEGGPAIFTSVARCSSWLRGMASGAIAAPAPGAPLALHPSLLLTLTVTKLGLPPNSSVIVSFHGATPGSASEALTEVLDSNCEVPKKLTAPVPSASFGERSFGLVSITLISEGVRGPCDAVCRKALKFEAEWSVEEFGVGTSGCNMQASWVDMNKLEGQGSAVTGGLGARRMEGTPAGQYGVWSCARDWNVDAQRACGAQLGELACFYYNEKSTLWDFQGLNRAKRLVDTQHVQRLERAAMDKLQGKTLDTLPPNDYHLQYMCQDDDPSRACWFGALTPGYGKHYDANATDTSEGLGAYPVASGNESQKTTPFSKD